MTGLVNGTLAVDHEGRTHVPDRETMADDQLRDTGADAVVGYPASGPRPLRG